MAASLKKIEEQISSLNPEQLKQFRAWYEEFDAADWDRQIESDAHANRSEELSKEALSEHNDGKSKWSSPGLMDTSI